MFEVTFVWELGNIVCNGLLLDGVNCVALRLGSANEDVLVLWALKVEVFEYVGFGCTGPRAWRRALRAWFWGDVKSVSVEEEVVVVVPVKGS